ncbi:helix-turn-helix transcriptional regulator, partial [Candidatus Woesearchaeota archaeon]|nr:helix-turn-helix transcriptional regulator [Candidatus Woesearchaeota archaeon]
MRIPNNREPAAGACQMIGKGFCPCPLEEAAAALSRKWTLTVLVTIGNFTTIRFNGLLSRIPKLNPKTLSDRLHELEQMKLVARTVYAEKPPRVEYQLTRDGASLRKAVIPLM